MSATTVILCLSSLVLALLPSFTHAQYKPAFVSGASCVFQEGKAMYFSGGSDGRSTLTQSFLLDLASPWEASAPKFSSLAPGPQDSQIANVLVDDNTWLLISQGSSFQYNIAQDSWVTVAALTNLYDTNTWALQGAIDPIGKNLYIPNGYKTSANTNTMMQYSTVSHSTSSVPMPLGLASVGGFSAVWSASLKSLVVFGGSSETMALDTLYTFNPSVGGGWSQPRTSGPTPLGRISHCSVSAYGGTKVVVFGGHSANRTTIYSDIHILDVATMTWTKGPDGGPAMARYLPGCAVSGDMFIAWGGLAAPDTLVNTNVTIVYDLKTNAWRTSYDPASSASYRAAPSGTGGSGASGGNGSGSASPSSSKAPIIGGVVGGVALVALMAGFLLYRRKKQKSQTEILHPKSDQERWSEDRLPQADSSYPQTQQQQHFYPAVQSVVVPEQAPLPLLVGGVTYVPVVSQGQNQAVYTPGSDHSTAYSPQPLVYSDASYGGGQDYSLPPQPNPYQPQIYSPPEHFYQKEALEAAAMASAAAASQGSSPSLARAPQGYTPPPPAPAPSNPQGIVVPSSYAE